MDILNRYLKYIGNVDVIDVDIVTWYFLILYLYNISYYEIHKKTSTIISFIIFIFVLLLFIITIGQQVLFKN